MAGNLCLCFGGVGCQHDCLCQPGRILAEASKTMVLAQNNSPRSTISHDDKYFDVADRIIKMDYGKLNGELQGSRPEPRKSKSQKSPKSEFRNPPGMGNGSCAVENHR
jgi:hypothetical protein